MGLLDLAAGFASGAGHALAETEMTNFKSLVEQDRQTALMKMQSQFRQDEHKANAIVTEGIRREGRDSDFNQDIAQAPQRADMAAEAAKKMELAKFSDEVIKARESALNMARSGELGFKMDNLGSIAAVERAEAQAKHIESAASMASAESTRLDMSRKKAIYDAQDSLASAEASGDADKISAARKQLSSLNSKGEDSRDASTLMRTAENIRRQAKDEFDPSRKAELERKAEQFETMALSQMNVSPSKQPKAGFDSKTGEVWKDGKVIGTAKTEKDARDLYANSDAKKADASDSNAGRSKKVSDERSGSPDPLTQQSVKPEQSKAGRIAEIESALRSDDNAVSIIGALTGNSIAEQKRSGKTFSGKLSLGERNSLEAELRNLKSK